MKQLIFSWVIFFNLFFLCLNFSLAQEVTGIVCDKKESYAIINGDVVKVGDTVDGGKVIEIKPNSVKFQYGNSIYEKKLTDKTPEVKKTEINPVQEPIKTQNTITIDNEEHYRKAKEYKQSGGDTHYTNATSYYQSGKYEEALKEAQYALNTVTGNEYDRMVYIIENSRKKIQVVEEIKRQEGQKTSSSVTNNYPSMEKTIADSKEEIRKKRNENLDKGDSYDKSIHEKRQEIKNKRTESGTGSGTGWHGSWEGNPNFHKMTPEEAKDWAKEVERRNNETPPPPVVCQGGTNCHLATSDEIKKFEK